MQAWRQQNPAQEGHSATLEEAVAMGHLLWGELNRR
ncbi:MAG: hypothetical protein HY675_05005 [Chloroflexi bacterium]|nr:hypothetical protein [Chloroflexota bacterium]